MSAAGEIESMRLLRVLKTVLFGAMGVRRKSDHERDAQSIHPAAILAAGLVVAVLFVLTIIFVVRLVLS